eukprot:1511277-Pleurochrysis_carterae.AAC.1
MEAEQDKAKRNVGVRRKSSLGRVGLKGKGPGGRITIHVVSEGRTQVDSGVPSWQQSLMFASSCSHAQAHALVRAGAIACKRMGARKCARAHRSTQRTSHPLICPLLCQAVNPLPAHFKVMYTTPTLPALPCAHNTPNPLNPRLA